jgi:hypothetical protein
MAVDKFMKINSDVVALSIHVFLRFDRWCCQLSPFFQIYHEELIVTHLIKVFAAFNRNYSKVIALTTAHKGSSSKPV